MLEQGIVCNVWYFLVLHGTVVYTGVQYGTLWYFVIVIAGTVGQYYIIWDLFIDFLAPSLY